MRISIVVFLFVVGHLAIAMGPDCGPGAAAQRTIPIDAEYAANNCEFYVNGFVYVKAAYIETWEYLLSYVSVDEASLVGRQGGHIERVGVLANGKDFVLGSPIAPAYYQIKLDLVPLVPTGGGGETPGPRYPLSRFSYFVDVKRASGKVERLWLSEGGKDFQWPAVYDGYPSVGVNNLPVGRGSAYALRSDDANASPLFNQRRACGH